MRVPSWTPSAPSTNAAAIEVASQMPPAATIGRSTFEGDQRQEDQGGRAESTLEAAALDSLDDDAVDPCVDRLLRGAQRADHVEDGHPGVVEPVGEQGRIAGRRRAT